MIRGLLLATTLVLAACPAGATRLDLEGYADADGAITVQRGGATVDPYFALQALLLAREEGIDAGALAVRWAQWLASRQKPDGTFDRFCRAGPVWVGCKAADADDALLALWLKFIDGLPADVRGLAATQRSREAACAALARLADERRHIYLVSALFQQGLFMDNLEVWSYAPAHAAVEGPGRTAFADAIRRVFWDAARGRFLVSTQPEQRDAPQHFYPDAVAQVFPLLVGYPYVPGGARHWYREWMRQHRREWLAQVQGDFAWGLIGLIAARQGDAESAGCWLRTTQAQRHGLHWTVTDEVVAQALARRRVAPAPAGEACP